MKARTTQVRGEKKVGKWNKLNLVVMLMGISFLKYNRPSYPDHYLPRYDLHHRYRHPGSRFRLPDN